MNLYQYIGGALKLNPMTCPPLFTETRAENRDLKAERRILEGSDPKVYLWLNPWG